MEITKEDLMDLQTMDLKAIMDSTTPSINMGHSRGWNSQFIPLGLLNTLPTPLAM